MSGKNNGKPPSLYGKHPSAFKALAISLALAFAYYIFNSGSGQITNLAKAPSEVTLEVRYLASIAKASHDRSSPTNRKFSPFLLIGITSE